nr:hypothetical protein Itr_chr03CG02790 [Ipomoea trifida]
MPTGSSMAFSQPLGILNSGVINMLCSPTFQELRRPSPNVLVVVTRDFLKPLTGIEATSPKISTPPPKLAVFANAGHKLKLPKQNRRDEEEAAATPEESVRRNKLIQCGEPGEETELSATNYYGFAHFIVASDD